MCIVWYPQFFNLIFICIMYLFESFLTFLMYLHTYGTTKTKFRFFQNFQKLKVVCRGGCAWCVQTLKRWGLLLRKLFMSLNQNILQYKSHTDCGKWFFSISTFGQNHNGFAQIFGGNPNMRVYKRILIFLEKKFFFTFT